MTPVLQPIVSLVDGKTYGYEALSRRSQKELEMNIEEMFLTAFKHNKSWELETLCRAKALEHSIHMEHSITEFTVTEGGAAIGFMTRRYC